MKRTVAAVIEFRPIAALRGYTLEPANFNYSPKERAAAAKRAWITIRANREKAAKAA
jgi:hypothetical protein